MAQTKKIAVIFHANLEDRKGQTNATLSRIKHFQEILPENMATEAICMSYYNGKLLNFVRRRNHATRPVSYIIDGCNIRLEWLKLSLVDYILKVILHRAPFSLKQQHLHIIDILKKYDLVSAHSYIAGEIALLLYRKFRIPYCVTWHGSDIHTVPFQSGYLLQKTKDIIENASVNFFVSTALLNKSDEITLKGNKTVLYNGVSKNFKLYSYENKRRLRTLHALNPQNKIVAFVGNLIPIKNASLLPAIFKNISENYQDGIEFWIIGDGTLRETIKSDIAKSSLKSFVKFFGNVQHSQMPELMNCIDLLVLPSQNEGLPLVTVEATHCGAMVIGSDVGGISEAIGADNVVGLGEDFINRFAGRCISALNGNYTFTQNSELDWSKTADKEVDIYSKIFENT